MGDDNPLLLLAATLVAAGIDLVVIGSTARLLRAELVEPNDLDVAVRAHSYPALAEVLGEPARSHIWGGHFTTSFGPLDVQCHDPLPPLAGHARIAGAEVAFA